MTLDEARENIGKKVIYNPEFGEKEVGVITSVNELYVFVRYGNDVISKSTNRFDIEFE